MQKNYSALLVLVTFTFLFSPLSAQLIFTVAGNGIQGYSGDGGPATAAELNWPANMALDKNGNMYMGSTRILLLGVLFAGPQHTAHGDIEIINIPTGQKQVVTSRIPNNLGLIIKSERILELEKLFKV